MKKQDLESRRVVELNNGDRYLVVGDMLMVNWSYIDLDTYTDDLEHRFDRGENIFRVYDKIQKFEDMWESDSLVTLWARGVKLRLGDVFYTINFYLDNSIQKFVYDGDELDTLLLDKGLVFRTEEEAIEAANKMLEVIRE